jgi:carbonic anhydrase/acetyltransferase-like protein (isoleucine patch superfamily)
MSSRKGNDKRFTALRLRSGQVSGHRGHRGNPATAAALTQGWALVVFSSSFRIMIRSYKGVRPVIPATCYVDDSAQIIGDVVLGEHASVWMNAVVRGDVHEIRIGAHSNVQDNSVLHGMKQHWGVYLGEYVTVGHTVTLHGCVIEDRCLIGMGSIILNGAKIGAGSIIAAGTVIPEGTVVEPGSLWMGSPGKFRRKLEIADQESIMRYARNYLGYKDEYLKER